MASPDRKSEEIQKLLNKLKKMLRREPEDPPATEDPYSHVGAPRRPRPGTRSGAAVAEEPD